MIIYRDHERSTPQQLFMIQTRRIDPCCSAECSVAQTILRNMSHETPVTTKAQLDAEGEDRVNSLNPRIHEFLSKIKKSAKSRYILNSYLTPTCGALMPY